MNWIGLPLFSVSGSVWAECHLWVWITVEQRHLETVMLMSNITQDHLIIHNIYHTWTKANSFKVMWSPNIGELDHGGRVPNSSWTLDLQWIIGPLGSRTEIYTVVRLLLSSSRVPPIWCVCLLVSVSSHLTALTADKSLTRKGPSPYIDCMPVVISQWHYRWFSFTPVVWALVFGHAMFVYRLRVWRHGIHTAREAICDSHQNQHFKAYFLPPDYRLTEVHSYLRSLRENFSFFPFTVCRSFDEQQCYTKL